MSQIPIIYVAITSQPTDEHQIPASLFNRVAKFG